MVVIFDVLFPNTLKWLISWGPDGGMVSSRSICVISTDEIQFNHKPTKMLLTEKTESAKIANPKISLEFAHIVY